MQSNMQNSLIADFINSYFHLIKNHEITEHISETQLVWEHRDKTENDAIYHKYRKIEIPKRISHR